MLDKKLSHFQAFGLKVFIFTAKVAKTKKLRERNGLLHIIIIILNLPQFTNDLQIHLKYMY